MPWNVFVTESQYLALRVHRPPYRNVVADNFENMNMIVSQVGSALPVLTAAINAMPGLAKAVIDTAVVDGLLRGQLIVHQSDKLCAARTLLGFLFYVPCQRWMSINVQVRRACLAPTIVPNALLSAVPGHIIISLGCCALTSHWDNRLDVLQVLYPNIVTLVAMVLAAWITMSTWMSGNAFAVITLLTQALIGVTTAMITGGVFVMSAWLPSTYVQASIRSMLL